MRRMPDDLELLVGGGNTIDVVNYFDEHALGRLFESL
jgi:hypothetical protein